MLCAKNLANFYESSPAYLSPTSVELLFQVIDPEGERNSNYKDKLILDNSRVGLSPISILY